MPTYVYECACGHVEEAVRPIAKRDEGFACGRCEQPMKRVISAVSGIVKDPAVEKKVRNKSKTISFPKIGRA